MHICLWMSIRVIESLSIYIVSLSPTVNINPLTTSRGLFFIVTPVVQYSSCCTLAQCVAHIFFAGWDTFALSLSSPGEAFLQQTLCNPLRNRSHCPRWMHPSCCDHQFWPDPFFFSLWVVLEEMGGVHFQTPGWPSFQRTSVSSEHHQSPVKRTGMRWILKWNASAEAIKVLFHLEHGSNVCPKAKWRCLAF